MSTIKTNNVQIGQSGTATQNFTVAVPASPDGTVKLARGNQGATTQDVVTVDSAGRVAFPQGVQTGPAISVVRITSNQSLTSSTDTVVQFNSELLDSAGCFDTSNYRFTPNVAGWYCINAAVATSVGSAFIAGIASVRKNGTVYRRGGQLNANTSGVTYYTGSVNTLIYLNGTTDYVDIIIYVAGTTLSIITEHTYLDAFLVRAA